MRINYLSLLDPYFYSGGGEKSWRTLLEQGRARGHEIKISSVYPKLRLEMFESPDLFILANLFNYGQSRRPWRFRPFFPKRIFAEIVTRGRFIHYDNAYCDVCDESYLPCNGKVNDDQCPWKSGLRKWVLGKGCLKTRTMQLYQNAILNVFVSPLHRRIIQSMLGAEVVGSFYEYLDIIDLTLFSNQGIERDIPFLFVGVLHEAKGLEEMRALFANQDLVLVGSSPGGQDPGFGRWLGPLPYQEVAGLMNRARNFVFLPRWPEPFGRVVAEAALCGSELITNDNVGARSFGLDLSQPESYREAGTGFWEKIEQL